MNIHEVNFEAVLGAFESTVSEAIKCKETSVNSENMYEKIEAQDAGAALAQSACMLIPYLRNASIIQMLSNEYWEEISSRLQKVCDDLKAINS